MPDDPKTYETKEGAKAQVRDHQLSWRGLYPYTPEVEAIPNPGVIDTTSGILDGRRVRQVLAASCHLRSATLDPLRSYRGFIVFPEAAVQRNEAKRLPRTAAKPSARGVRLSDGLAT